MSSLIPHDYRYKISSPTPVDKEPFLFIILLNQFGLSWSGSYKDYYSEDTVAVASSRGPIDQSCNEYERPSKIAILVNSRCVKENLSKEANLSMSRLIEEEMTYFSFIPYQICNCAYIGEHKAWAMYNLNNKRTLSLAINEINYHLGTLHDLEEDSAIEKPIAGLDKSQYGGFSTDEYTFDYENDESYPETLREKLYDKGLGKLYIMRNIPFWSDALEATPYHANINAGAAAFYRVEGGHKYEPDINYLHNGKYKDMKGDKNYYEM